MKFADPVNDQLLNTLIFDTETTGLVKRTKDGRHPKQPMAVQIGMKLDASDRTERGVCNYLIQTDGWVVEPEAFRATGINNKIADAYGVNLVPAVEMFLDFADVADRFVIHNAAFDTKVIQRMIQVWSDWTGHAYIDPFEGKPVICTMEAATPILKLPPRMRGTTYKWPKLAECIKYFWNEELEGAHDALVDVRATARLFYHLVDEGVFVGEDHVR